MSPLPKVEVVRRVSIEVQWWIKERLKKFRELGHETMAVNPFMAPLLFALHSHADFDELAEFLLGGHFMVGHSTGFGKLLDEKILPNVFKTTKLNAAFRKVAPYDLPVFSEIDHVIPAAGGGSDLLSLKASRWTIQLTMAVQLNHSFKELIDLRSAGTIPKFNRIVVGVIYGTESTLTDKFAIIRGICTGANHDVFDLRSDVTVVAGRNLWTLVNGGEAATQDWIMDGILDAISKTKVELKAAIGLLDGFKKAFADEFQKFINADKKIDWHRILSGING